MNKKTYITPAIEVINLMVESNMLAGSTYNDNETIAPGEELSAGRRGSWGDLWDKGE